MLTDVYIIVILLAFLAGIVVYFKNNMPLYLRLLPANLAFVFVLELVGVLLANRGVYNVNLYNVLGSVQITFYLWVMHQIVVNKSIRRILFYTIFFYPVLVILNKLFVQKGMQFVSITVALGCLLVVLSAIYYFYELFQSDKSVDLLHEPSFWIASGLLFFYSCSFPLFTLLNYFYSPSNKIIIYITYLSSVLNILLYSSFIIAFLCRIRIRKFSL
ncbi:MAG: hypothetical protein KIT80_01470 [Chitinophagaceae bacterium]|nr:hypothetical protein [Chitinophagaceae bacterium]MCW5925555.1 hypothetical protein [Chitinophagaceae bacterium]